MRCSLKTLHKAKTGLFEITVDGEFHAISDGHLQLVLVLLVAVDDGIVQVAAHLHLAVHSALCGHTAAT